MKDGGTIIAFRGLTTIKVRYLISDAFEVYKKATQEDIALHYIYDQLRVAIGDGLQGKAVDINRKGVLNDNYFTRDCCWECLYPLIPKDTVIWDPFFGNGESGKCLYHCLLPLK